MNPATCWVSCGNHFLQVRSSSNDLAEQAPKAGLNSALGFQHWCDLHSKLVQVTVAYKCQILKQAALLGVIFVSGEVTISWFSP